VVVIIYSERFILYLYLYYIDEDSSAEYSFVFIGTQVNSMFYNI